MASITNIQMDSFTAGVSEIALGSNNIVQVVRGGDILWEVGAGPTEEWLDSSAYALFVEYTPPSNQVLVSMSMTYNTTQAYNYCWGIWTASGSNAVPLAGFIGINSTSGVSFVNGGTLGADTKYTHTKTWASGSRATLTSGTTYLFWLGERYTTKKIVGVGTSNTWDVYEWSLSTGGNANVASTSSATRPTLTLVME